jgi:hypothetical protein
MADANENLKKQMEAEKEVRDKAREHHDSTIGKSKPTPTQEENDKASLGEHIKEHADDGSGPDPHAPGAQTKESRPASSGGGYQTRQARPAPTPTPHRSE